MENYKLYVWNKKNVNEFDNYYGDTLVAVVADSPDNALKTIQKRCPRAYLIIQQFHNYEIPPEMWKPYTKEEKYEQIEARVAEYFAMTYAGRGAFSDQAIMPYVMDIANGTFIYSEAAN